MSLSRRLLAGGVWSLLVPGSVCGLVPWAIQRHGSPPLIEPGVTMTIVGWLLIVLAAALYLWCAWDFATRGAGTPNPLEPPRHLVVTGPYRWARNPMFLAVLLAQSGHVLRWPAPAILGLGAGSLVFVLAFVLCYEEPSLTRRFGDAYTRYRHAVPRFLPRPWRRG